MLNTTSYINHQPFLKRISMLMFMMLFIMTAAYFTWSDNITITRLIKIAARFSATAGTWYIFRMLVHRGAIASFKWYNEFAPLLYACYLGLGFISVLWSTDKAYSMLQWFMDFESLVFAFYFMRCFMLLDNYFPGHHIRFYNLLGNTAFVLLLIFVAGMYLDPDTFFRMTHGGEESRLGGFIMNPNELGMLCGVGISCLLFDMYRNHRRWLTVFKMALMLYGLILTGSRSSLVGLMLIIFFHIRRSSNKKLKLMMYAGAVAAIPLIVTQLMIKENGGGVDEVLSMTGRLPFWSALLNEAFPKEPFLGYGFMRIYYTDTFQGANTYAGHMTHNTFLQALMNLGIIGFTIAILQLFFTVRGFIHTKDLEKKLMLQGILIPVIINSFTEFGIFGETNYGILFYQLLIFSVCITKTNFTTRAEKIYLKKRRPDLAEAA